MSIRVLSLNDVTVAMYWWCNLFLLAARLSARNSEWEAWSNADSHGGERQFIFLSWLIQWLCSNFYDRVSWSYPAAIIPSLLNVFSMQGYLILNSIVGGQTLAAVSPDRLNATLGIVIIGVVSMVVCIEFSSVDMNLSWRLIQVALCGYRVVHLRVYCSLIIRATLILG